MGPMECQIDLRVGGEWTFVCGLADRSGEPDPNRSVFTEIDRSTSVTGRRSSPSRSQAPSSSRTERRS